MEELLKFCEESSDDVDSFYALNSNEDITEDRESKESIKTTVVNKCKL